MKKIAITISVALAVELAIILLICGLNGVLTTSVGEQEVARYLCDGFFVSGVLFLGVGGLMWTSKLGTFDGIGYTVSRWKDSLFNNRRDWHEKEKYAEYKKRVAEKKKNKDVDIIIIIGGVALVVASMLLLVYNFAY